MADLIARWTNLLSPSVVRSGGCLGPIFFRYRASINNNFISENGLVAVLGDENQIVVGDSEN